MPGVESSLAPDIKDSLLLLPSSSSSSSILPGLMIAIIDLCWRDRPGVVQFLALLAAVRSLLVTEAPLHSLYGSPHHLQPLTTPANTAANIQHCPPPL